LYSEGLRLAQEAQVDRLVRGIYGNLGDLALLEHDVARAAQFHKTALGMKSKLELRGHLVQNVAGLGRAAVTTGQTEQGVRLLSAASCLREAIGVGEPFEEKIEAQVLSAARQTLGEEAFTAAWEGGRSMPLEQAVAEAMALEVTSRSASTLDGTAINEPVDQTPRGAASGTSASPLSPREHEVAAHVARGLTNREIGRALFVSERTIDTHVQHILSKLGFSSRTQIAAWAAKQGLDTAFPA
jgi:DNA-binding NarL/FixJ family response regulator